MPDIDLDTARQQAREAKNASWNISEDGYWAIVESMADAVLSLADEVEKLHTARRVAEHWCSAIMAWDDGKWAAHPLCMVLAALDGETDPAQLGMSADA